MKAYLWYVAILVILCVGLEFAQQPDPPVDHCRPPAEFMAQVKEDVADSKRSPHWPSVEKAFRHGGTVNIGTREAPIRVTYSAHPYCAYCGSTESIQVHHVHQFRDMTPEQRGANVEGGELAESNLISLCEVTPDDHHLRVGHLGNFKTSNPNVRDDCAKHEAEMRAAGKWPQK